MKKALIVGCMGQDGSYLFEYLDKKGYRILGIDRQKTRTNADAASGAVDILKPIEVAICVKEFQPDEIYYLAAFHHSSEDVQGDEELLFRKSFNVHVHGLIYVLDAVKEYAPKARLFYAASSHIFGDPQDKIQNESTPLVPMCVYGITKTAGLEVCQYYRRELGIFASVGILYNHESPLREPKFVSQKIVQAALAIKQGRQKELVLGDLEAAIDWGFAGDYVEAMHAILSLPAADDFVIASGQMHTVKDFVQGVFQMLDLDWKQYVREDSALIKKSRRHLQGDSTKLKKASGWTPKTDFQGLIRLMVSQGQAHAR